MSAGWVAGSVRARGLARRLGADGTRQLASCSSLSDALQVLAATRYGANIRPEQPLAVAQREIASSVLWDLRVLAGWLPPDGLRLLRTLGAWFELANVDELLQVIAGRPADAEFRFGALATAWPRLRQAGSHAELRSALAASAWRDPGGETVHAIRLGLRAQWAARAAALGDPARTWAAGAAALLVAGSGSPSAAPSTRRSWAVLSTWSDLRPFAPPHLTSCPAGSRPGPSGCSPGSPRPPTCGGRSRPGWPGSSRTACGYCAPPAWIAGWCSARSPSWHAMPGGPGERSRSPPGAGRRRRPTMSWLDAAVPVRMKRVALVVADESLRDMLVRVADAAAVEIGPAGGDAVTSGPASDQPATGGEAALGGQAGRRLQRAAHPVADAALAASRPDLDALEQAGRYELLAGEAQLEAYAATAVGRYGASALAGWIPAGRLAAVSASLAEVGCSVVLLPYPRGIEPPTRVAGRPLRRSLSPLVQMYGTVPYADIDPTWLAWGAYVLMFGMMFGDAGEGVALIAVAAALRAGWPRWARRFRQAWPFVGGAGAAATLFGLLYGECFGPTGLVPTLWPTRWIIRSPCSLWRPASARSCSRARTRSAQLTGGGKAAGCPRCTRHRASRGPACSSARAS